MAENEEKKGIQAPEPAQVYQEYKVVNKGKIAEYLSLWRCLIKTHIITDYYIVIVR